ncbi:MAG: SIMPL domain-containing protein [Lewinella sp.]|nr:SIMPL domain-containing protein [Lewinella sp.]
MKRFPLFFLFLLPLAAIAQQAGNYVQYQNFDLTQNQRFLNVQKEARILANNILEIKVNALYNQQAGSYVAVFSIVQLGKTTGEANSLLNERLNAFVKGVQGLGVAPGDVFVDMVNFLPKYELDVSKKLFSKKSYTEIPKGFELQKNVHIKYTKPEILDEIVTIAAGEEIYDLVKVDYFGGDPQKVYEELRQKSFNYLNDLKTIYKQIGIELDSATLLTAENTWVAFPGNRYETYQAYSSQSFEGIEKGSAVNTVNKPVSRFYNAVPTNDYDIVINPEVLEPVIQYSYNLVARFTFPVKVPDGPKKEYMLVTPNGDVVPLNVRG